MSRRWRGAFAVWVGRATSCPGMMTVGGLFFDCEPSRGVPRSRGSLTRRVDSLTATSTPSPREKGHRSARRGRPCSRATPHLARQSDRSGSRCTGHLRGASESNKKRPPASCDGHESRRWRESVAGRRKHTRPHVAHLPKIIPGIKRQDTRSGHVLQPDPFGLFVRGHARRLQVVAPEVRDI